MSYESRGHWVPWKHGEYQVLYWDMKQDLQMLTSSPAKYPYRIGFVLDDDGIVPLQQCVTLRDENSHRIPQDRWVRDPSAVLSAEYSIISSFIERECLQASAAASEKVRKM